MQAETGADVKKLTANFYWFANAPTRNAPLTI